MSSKILLFAALAVALLVSPFSSRAQVTAFTYQGQLMDSGSPANGSYDFQLNVYSVATGGSAVSGPLILLSTPVTNGLFTIVPDFGSGVFTGSNLWLDIGVRKSGGGGFVTLTTRQPFTAAPYAIYAPNAGTVSGTLAISNLPSGVALLNGNQTFTGNVQFSNPSNSYNGTFAGNGAGVTNVSVVSLNSGGEFTWAGAFRPGFTLPTGSQPAPVATGDFNNDGRLDLVAADFGDGTILTFTNNGAGGLAATTNNVGAGAQPISVVVADVNNDGRPDIITANFTGNTVSIFTNTGTNSFVLFTNLGSVNGPEFVTVADINGDNKPDIIIANAASGATVLTVFTNNGSGFFTFASFPTTGAVQVGVAVADVNGDGRPDLITANFNSTTLSILTNKGGGQFALLNSVVVGANPRAVIALDLNGDGRTDLACVDEGANVLVTLTNNGSGVFTTNAIYPTGQFPTSLIATNTSGSSKPDLICANSGATTLSIFTNNGSGAFGPAFTAQVGANPETVVATDVNGDGRPDLIAACTGANDLAILYNAVTFNAGNLTVWGGLAVNSSSFAVNTNVIYYSGLGTNVGINNTNPTTALDVHGVINATGGYTQVSDSRYKTNVATLVGALDKIMALRGVGYDWRRADFPEMNFNDARQLGFLAQELANVLPEAVTRDAEGHLSVAYSEVVPVLVEALKEETQKADAAAKEQDEKIGALQKRLADLEKLAGHSMESNAVSPPPSR